MNYRVINFKGARLLPSSNVTIIFTTTMSLQKSLYMTRSTLLDKLCLSYVGYACQAYKFTYDSLKGKESLQILEYSKLYVKTHMQ